MVSDKLRKYLAYYQKTLKADPENIEARLRLAAIFKEMGRKGHAVSEYVTAAKLLAREGLPLEAIAACKAVLELEPNHTETQFFLAKLYARVPDATGDVGRVARPLDDAETLQRRRVEQSTNQPPKAVEPERSHITLDMPKFDRAAVEAAGSQPAADDEAPTRVGQAEADELVATEQPTRSAAPEEAVDPEDLRITTERKVTKPMGSVDSTAEIAEADGAQAGADDEDLRATTEMDPTDREAVLREAEALAEADLRRTIDIGEDDIVGEESLDTASEAERARHGTLNLDSPFKPSRHRPQTMRGVPTVNREAPVEETFEVGVFDMESLGLDDSTSTDWSDLSVFDDDEPDTSELDALDVAETGERPSVMRVRRGQLPQIPLLSRLSPDTFVELLRVIDHRHEPAGTVLVEPGEEAPSLFILVRGEVAVTKTLDDGQTIELARMGEGEFFGEFVLLTGRSGRATVRAVTEVVLLELRKPVVARLGKTDPKIWDVLWDIYHARLLNNLLASSVIFRSLPADERRRLAADFQLVEVDRGDLLLGQGERDDDLYLISDGRIRVERPTTAGGAETIDVLEEGDFLGLISSSAGEPVVADLRAELDSRVLVLAGERFRQVMETFPQVARAVDEMVRQRRANAARISGSTGYADLGLPGMGEPQE